MPPQPEGTPRLLAAGVVARRPRRRILVKGKGQEFDDDDEDDDEHEPQAG